MLPGEIRTEVGSAIVLVRLTMFNKRRISEVEELAVYDYMNRQSDVENRKF